MVTDRNGLRSLNSRGQGNSSRRAFIAKTAGCAAGMALLGFPGMISEVSAQKAGKSREEIIQELEGKVEKYMQKLGTCSQTSFSALNDAFELKGETAVPALRLFAGGIVSRGETCGAVTGSLLALGMSFGPKDKMEYGMMSPSMKAGGLFFDRFVSEFGSTRCSAVVEHQYGRAYDFRNADDMKLFMEAASTGKCTEVVRKAVLIAADIIMEEG